nr:NEL domain-containing protein [Pseudomonas synxantha]
MFEENVLRGVPGDELRLRGQRLLNLSRQLFRLDRVDSLAEANAKGMDRAEVRLHYRVGMTRGWPDGLELPGQPSYMAFATPISGPELLQARTEILAAEASEAFYESLLARDYWLSYLRERHGQAFEALEENARRRQEALEDEYSARQSGTESQERYEVALNLLEIELGSARAQKLLELSRQEVQELSAGAAPTPRPASPQPGPSSRH